MMGSRVEGRQRSRRSRWWRVVRSPRQLRVADDRGGAIVEFLGIAVLALIPLTYLIISLAQVQAATYAAESIARSASRTVVSTGIDSIDHGTPALVAYEAGVEQAHGSALLIAEDFGVTPPDLALSCEGECLAPGSEILAHVRIDVPLPGVPDLVRRAIPMVVTVDAAAPAHVPGSP